jgi:hypothetical protein
VSKAASEGQRWSVKHGYTAFPKLTALLPDRKSVVASARTMALSPPRVLLRTQALTERFAQLTRERLQRSRGRFPPDWRDLTGWASNNWRVLRSLAIPACHAPDCSWFSFPAHALWTPGPPRRPMTGF